VRASRPGNQATPGDVPKPTLLPGDVVDGVPTWDAMRRRGSVCSDISGVSGASVPTWDEIQSLTSDIKAVGDERGGGESGVEVKEGSDEG